MKESSKLYKIKVTLHGSSDVFPVTFIGKYKISTNKKTGYKVIVVNGKEIFGKESVWTFYEPLCSWTIV